VVKHYREQFDAGVAGNDWDAVLRVATAALALEPKATDWMGEALATHPDGLAAVPAEVLGRLPASMFASLPPAKLPTIRNSIGIELKLLPAGSFTMGQAGGDSDETPHQVTLTKPFYIGVYEVTNAQWKQVMGNVPSNWKNDDRPVEQVSWEDAMEFCKKLSALPEERDAGRIYRLPTEAEWEYACRARAATKYSFGEDESMLGGYGWFNGNCDSQTQRGGGKKPNAWGLYDMHGNVWEWCSDWYGDFPKGTVTDPQGSPLASGRVFRGGSCHSAAKSCRSANRDSNSPLFRYGNLGFRLALSLTQGGPPEAAVSSERRPGGLPAEPATAVDAAAGGAMKPRIHSLPPDVPETIKNSIGVTLKLIPAGTFVMGDTGGDSDETPHQVTLTKPFYMGVHEVTNAEWERVMGSVPSHWKDANHPVEQVSWEDAAEFCRKLSALPEERNAGRIYRLPTEAEWEYACRSGTDTKYSFGDDQSKFFEYGWCTWASDGQTHPVGQKKPNAWGLFDMNGNVWEWCSDWFDKYPEGAVTDPQGPPGPPAARPWRVLRGGSWLHDCQTAGNRSNDYPSRHNNCYGFRLALSLSGVQYADPEGPAVK
jgi:formylglycine-generating enzyme required for sulfatase activity